MNKYRLLQLTRELINIPSVTGQEGEIGRFLCRYLSNNGFSIREQEVSPGRFNIFASKSDRVDLLFSAHLDTVAPYIPLSEDETTLYGRGACDVKGGLAAMVEAVISHGETEGQSAGLLFVVGEEYDSDGAKAANQWGMVQPRAIVISEPTENRLAVGQKGALLFRLKARGKSAHSAYPELGESAIEPLIESLRQLTQIDFPQDDYFGETTLNIGVIRGGTKVNVIPDYAEAEIIMRLAIPYSQVLEKTMTCLHPQVELETISRCDPIRLTSVPKFESIVVAFGSDAPYLTNFGERLLIGPGSIHDAHTDHEKINKVDLKRAVEMYRNLIKIYMT
ncbi:MAG: hypothetical protein B6244_08735 [Candidatus Cloacimonetes bacterium 4572_55]|nr:MAG: hypothetical protein B6244_08735 [Candidatus Cloacimonetes bacterium 4572_55]